jgi:DNA-binding GntR family transcriptional regulator
MSDPLISRTNLVGEAYAAIKQFIIGGELAPGSQLKIDTLSRRLGVSSSPIREALRRLEQERWIEAIPFRGAFVRPFDETEIVEVYEIREFIELAALRKAMPDVPREALDTLSKALSDIVSSLRNGDQAGYLSADMRFHQIIVGMAGNARLNEMFATLVEQGRCFMLGRTPDAMLKYKDGHDEHTELFEAIMGGSKARAMGLLHQHLRISLDEIRRWVQMK